MVEQESGEILFDVHKWEYERIISLEYVTAALTHSSLCHPRHSLSVHGVAE